MKIYDLVWDILRTAPHTRNDDKYLMWLVWDELGFASETNLRREEFFNKHCPTPESITRCRRKIQELHPELQANKIVKQFRDYKADSKGTFIYREETKPLSEIIRKPKTMEELRKEVELMRLKSKL